MNNIQVVTIPVRYKNFIRFVVSGIYITIGYYDDIIYFLISFFIYMDMIVDEKFIFCDEPLFGH